MEDQKITVELKSDFSNGFLFGVVISFAIAATIVVGIRYGDKIGACIGKKFSSLVEKKA